MLRRPKKLRNFSSNAESQENDSIPNLKINNSYITISNQKPPLRQNKTPNSLRNALGFQQDPNFSKVLPKDISLDKERLIEENIIFKTKASNFAEENETLKEKLSLLMQAQENEVYQKVPKMKKKIRDLQKLMTVKEEDIAKLKNNIKSTKIDELENKLQSFIDEANRLKYLLEKILENQQDFENEDNSEIYFESGLEIQALRKENIELSQCTIQTNHELENLKIKLTTLGKLRKKKNLDKKLKNLRSVHENLEKNLKVGSEMFENKEKELVSVIQNSRTEGIKHLKDLEELETRYNQQEALIRDMRKKLHENKVKNFPARRTKTLVKVKEQEETPVKLPNPPRLLVKINQYLKKKKMLISVFLSLIDKNSNGLIFIENLVQGMSLNGKRLKKKHITEVFEMLGITTNYVSVGVLEDFYEKFMYDNQNYKSSSEEEIFIKKFEKQTSLSPPRSTSPVKPLEKKQENIKPEIVTQKIVLNEVPAKILPTVSFEEISDFVQEIRLKMGLNNLTKGKIIPALFGNDFDPDEQLSLENIKLLLDKNSLQLENNEKKYLFTRFLLENEKSKTIKEDEIKNLKGCLRDISKKLQKIIPDWVIFTESDEKSFEKFIFEKISPLNKEILQLCEEFSPQSDSKLNLEDFFKILSEKNLIFPQNICDWLKISMFRSGNNNQIPYKDFLKKYEILEPNFSQVSPNKFAYSEVAYTNQHEIINQMLNEIANTINQIWPISFFENSEILLEDFVQFLHNLNLEYDDREIYLLSGEFLMENTEKFTKTISNSRFFNALLSHGLIQAEESEEYIDENFENIQEEYSKDNFEQSVKNFTEKNPILPPYSIDENYNESFENIEEVIQVTHDHETELEFIQYGISIDK